LTRLTAVLVVAFAACLGLGPRTGVRADPPDPNVAACVEQFNIAVGTPGEYPSVFHQDKLGLDVSYFATLPKEQCPF
jgi:hypothetical protein